MYVVKRPFKSLGKYYAVGTVITDPTAIKRFNGKVAEGKIVNVTEQTYDSAAKYFKEKFFVDLPPLTLNAEKKSDENQNDENQNDEDQNDENQNDENQTNKEAEKASAVAVAKASVVSAK